MSVSKLIILIAFCAVALVACQAPSSGAGGPAIGQAALPSATAIQAPPPTPTETLPADQLLDLAQDAANGGAWQEAIELLGAAIAQDGQDAQAFLLRGNAYKGLGQNDLALEDYNQAVSLDPNSATAFNSRGLLYFETGDNQLALADFAQAIQLTPTFALAYRNRAEVQKSLGNSAAAALDLQIYLTFVPNAPDRTQVEAEIADLQAQTVQAAAEDGLLFSDDFSDAESGWYTNGDPVNDGVYAGDGYVLRVTHPEGDSSGAVAVWAMPGRLYSDVRVEVTARKQNGTDNNIYGILCRLQGNSGDSGFYAFLISSDGYYVIAKRPNQEEIAGIDQDNLLPSSQIKLGEETNKITAICSGSRLALFVNDELVDEVTDGDFTSGQVALFAGTYEGTTSIFFDDFKVFSEPQQ